MIIGPADIAAIRNLPGENYLLDVESATLDMTLHYKLSSQWTLYGIATAVSYHGGFMDSGIEAFHDTFGFSDFGRPAIARNETNLILDLKGAQVVMLDCREDPGLHRPDIRTALHGIKLPGRWQMSVEVAAKVPLEGERMLLSTGRTDYGYAGVGAAPGRAQRVSHGSSRRCTTPAKTFPRRTRRRSCRPSDPGMGTAADGAHQFQPAGLCEPQRVHARADRPRRAAERQIPGEHRHPSPLRLLPGVLRHHRKSSEPEQHAGHRLSAGLCLGAEAGTAEELGLTCDARPMRCARSRRSR